ncbi:hypothetical protein K1719_010752 [Acacia pycnantha]|nr:hypothetical protein K1719_010752 [Acacia pycnantha]
MASNHRPASSGSDDPRSDVMGERKRMQSNRESARRSQMKKQKQLEDLTNEISRLQSADYGIVRRLRFLNSMLEIADEVIGLSVEIPEIPDPLLKPWQLPYLIQPITTSDFVLH